MAVLSVLVLMLLAACGGASSTDSGAKSGEDYGRAGTAAGAGTTLGGATTRKTVTINESEFKLNPSQVILDEPGTYIFEAKSIGTITRALQIEGN